MLLVAKMTGQLSFHGSLDQRLGKLFHDSLWPVEIVQAVVDTVRKGVF
jgi:hypothetical protein